MNLPDMLRHRHKPFIVTGYRGPYQEHIESMSIAEELAALVEAADRLRTVTDDTADLMYDTAHAALVAKIGGKG